MSKTYFIMNDRADTSRDTHRYQRVISKATMTASQMTDRITSISAMSLWKPIRRIIKHFIRIGQEEGILKGLILKIKYCLMTHSTTVSLAAQTLPLILLNHFKM